MNCEVEVDDGYFWKLEDYGYDETDYEPYLRDVAASVNVDG